MSAYFYSPPDPDLDVSTDDVDRDEMLRDARWRRMSPEDREAELMRLAKNYGGTYAPD